MRQLRLRRLAPPLLAMATCLALAAPVQAGEGAIQVGGRQTVIDEEAGTFAMKGSLVGTWQTTGFTEVATSPLYEATGTERFTGCLDRRRDRSCKGDPSGTLTFSFRYWGAFDGLAFRWGSCWHPITGGTGAFTGADGVLTFVDTPTKQGVRTRYIGSLTLASGASSHRAKRAARASAAPRCGPSR